MSTGGNASKLSCGSSCGQGEISAEHQRMADLIQTLNAHIRDHQSKDAICAIARALSQISELHFAHERELMDTTGYPDANAHLWEHRVLLDKLSMLIHSLETTEADASTYIIDFIDRWFIDHVQGRDAEFGAFLAKRG